MTIMLKRIFQSFFFLLYLLQQPNIARSLWNLLALLLLRCYNQELDLHLVGIGSPVSDFCNQTGVSRFGSAFLQKQTNKKEKNLEM